MYTHTQTSKPFHLRTADERWLARDDYSFSLALALSVSPSIHTSFSKYYFLSFILTSISLRPVFTILFFYAVAAASGLRETMVFLNVDAFELDSHFEHSYRYNTYLYNDLHNKSVSSIVVLRSRKMRERFRCRSRYVRENCKTRPPK